MSDPAAPPDALKKPKNVSALVVVVSFIVTFGAGVTFLWLNNKKSQNKANDKGAATIISKEGFKRMAINETSLPKQSVQNSVDECNKSCFRETTSSKYANYNTKTKTCFCGQKEVKSSHECLTPDTEWVTSYYSSDSVGPCESWILQSGRVRGLNFAVNPKGTKKTTSDAKSCALWCQYEQSGSHFNFDKTKKTCWCVEGADNPETSCVVDDPDWDTGPRSDFEPAKCPSKLVNVSDCKSTMQIYGWPDGDRTAANAYPLSESVQGLVTDGLSCATACEQTAGVGAIKAALYTPDSVEKDSCKCYQTWNSSTACVQLDSPKFLDGGVVSLITESSDTLCSNSKPFADCPPNPGKCTVKKEIKPGAGGPKDFCVIETDNCKRDYIAKIVDYDKCNKCECERAGPACQQKNDTPCKCEWPLLFSTGNNICVPRANSSCAQGYTPRCLKNPALPPGNHNACHHDSDCECFCKKD